ncbi:MAG TPA: thioredoxin [Bacteroidales bacterium]|jgi:thioredoxin 1|nr:thioredoxin [Bacteroidales bacterium]MDD4394841.1 thioredoxin [Bacteroidales bacterium]HNW67391.1 thioredoxin [Bacteroidales bacterium]HPT51866.1 thioredoxin [Bacteroidales bacterium]
MALEINESNFNEITKTDKLVVIDFWATWCGPCRALSPIIEELAEEYKGSVVIGKCDTDQNNGIAMQFGVRNIPMLVFMKNGEVVETLVGLMKKSELVKVIDSLK